MRELVLASGNAGTLRAGKKRRIVAVFTVYTDTASGATCDLNAIRAAIDAAGHPTLFVSDIVASLAAAPFAMDALGVDAAVGASQKGPLRKRKTRCPKRPSS